MKRSVAEDPKRKGGSLRMTSRGRKGAEMDQGVHQNQRPKEARLEAAFNRFPGVSNAWASTSQRTGTNDVVSFVYLSVTPDVVGIRSVALIAAVLDRLDDLPGLQLMVFSKFDSDLREESGASFLLKAEGYDPVALAELLDGARQRAWWDEQHLCWQLTEPSACSET